MIEVRGLNKTFLHNSQSISILNDINFKIEKGEIFGVIGKSGAGKSTLLRCLNLLEQPDSGQVYIDNIDLTSINMHQLRQIRQKIGVIFQGFNLLNSKTVFQNVALPLILQGSLSKSKIKDKVDSLLNLVGLYNLANKYPGKLSGGQKQRVGIARALTTDPKILLSDEATSALDPQTTTGILDIVLDINDQLGLTIILITHEIEVVRKICDKVAVLDQGKIIECGPTTEVFLHPKEELTRRLIVEEETAKYLEQVSDFYKFDKQSSNNLMLISFLGNQTFEPILSKIAHESGVVFSILRGELGRIKRIPFGQLLVEIQGDPAKLEHAFNIFTKLNVHFEIIA